MTCWNGVPGARSRPLRFQRSAGQVTITDDGRIRASLPTLRALTGAGAGRDHRAPGPAERCARPQYTLAPVASGWTSCWAPRSTLATDLVGLRRTRRRRAVGRGGRAPGERALRRQGDQKDDGRARRTADDLVDVVGAGAAFVSDGFGAVHRKQASVYDVALLSAALRWLPGQREAAVLRKLTEEPDRPYAVLLGGSKVSDKLGVITSLLRRSTPS